MLLGASQRYRDGCGNCGRALRGLSPSSSESLKALQADMLTCKAELAAAIAQQAELEEQLTTSSEQLSAEQEMVQSEPLAAARCTCKYRAHVAARPPTQARSQRG